MTLVFYDGLCGLCDRLVRFILARDRHARFRFATLQGELARQLLPPFSVNPRDLDSVVVVTDWPSPAHRIHVRSRAVIHALDALGFPWSLIARLFRVVPSRLADAAYRGIARRRYRLFGKLETCPLPPPQWRDRFLDGPNREP